MKSPIPRPTSSVSWLFKPLRPFRVAILVTSISIPLVLAENVPIYKNANEPVSDLQGFQRVSLKPGETKSVSISVPAKELELLDRDMKRVIEPGSFTVMVGSHSENLPLKGAFSVK